MKIGKTDKQFIAMILSIFAIAIVIYFIYNKSSKTESNWKPEYADPNKLKRSMMGMASEGNSVAGMIANPKYGAMVHS